MQNNSDGPVLGKDDARILYQVLTDKGSTKMAGRVKKIKESRGKKFAPNFCTCFLISFWCKT
jgi:hypothetical protein